MIKLSAKSNVCKAHHLEEVTVKTSCTDYDREMNWDLDEDNNKCHTGPDLASGGNQQE